MASLYDALGRVTKVTTPDGAYVTTTYSGNSVTVEDQHDPNHPDPAQRQGRKRRSETDALGRLTKVTEDPTGLNYHTPYLYDVLELHYNNRLQMVDLRLGNSSTDEWNWGRGALIYYYGTDARTLWNPFANSLDNNGNLLLFPPLSRDIIHCCTFFGTNVSIKPFRHYSRRNKNLE